jgi:hypothetical protein
LNLDRELTSRVTSDVFPDNPISSLAVHAESIYQGMSLVQLDLGVQGSS